MTNVFSSHLFNELIRALLIAIIISVPIALMITILPDAFADPRYDTNLNGAKLINPDGSGGSSILNGGSTIVNSIVDIALPIAIVIIGWKVIYLAAMPILAGVDPLNMLDDFSDNVDFQSGWFNSNEREEVMKRQQNRDMPALSYHTTNSSTTYTEELSIRQQGKTAIKAALVRFGKGLFIILIVWSVLKLIMWGVVILMNQFGSNNASLDSMKNSF